MRETHEVGLQSSFSIFFPTAGLKCHTQFRRISHRFNLHYLDPVFFLKSPFRLPPPCLCISLFLTHLHRISALNCSVLRIPLFFWAFCVCVCVYMGVYVCLSCRQIINAFQNPDLFGWEKKSLTTYGCFIDSAYICETFSPILFVIYLCCWVFTLVSFPLDIVEIVNFTWDIWEIFKLSLLPYCVIDTTREECR